MQTASPIKIKNLQLQSRIIMPPMKTGKATPNGVIGEELLDYYAKRAANPNVSLIITEHCYIDICGKASENQMSIDDACDMDAFKALADTIHQNGAKVFVQINHAGSAADPAITGVPAVGPSAIAHPHTRHQKGQDVQALTAEQIHQITQQFVRAAVRVKEAGFDGVEIHCAHGYLLNQFYSPLSNKRDDEYGCDTVENRVRFQLEVISAVREAVGEDYPIAIRLGGCDYTEGGATVEDAVAACKLFEQAGADLLDITGGMFGYIYQGLDFPGYFKEMTAAIKREVSIPVLLTGGVKTVKEAESLLEEGAADLIGVGRALFADANWEK